jgi:light-regulated signal transduction histidine kinase (bacteriophytochrome)
VLSVTAAGANLDDQYRPSSTEARLSERLEVAEKDLATARADFALLCSSISHDLRAPLRIMRGYADLLAADHVDDLPENARGYVGAISRSAESMTAMLDGLVRLARIGADDVCLVDVEIAPLVERCWERLSARPADAQLAVDGSGRCRCDVRLLEGVWTELLENAVAFAGPAPLQVRVSVRPGPSNVECTIADNGVGFDAAFVGRLFRPFQRLHSRTEFAGVGLGLCRAERALRHFGGAIRATGAPGQGATFTVTLATQ